MLMAARRNAGLEITGSVVNRLTVQIDVEALDFDFG
jgi:hypothetical protein